MLFNGVDLTVFSFKGIVADLGGGNDMFSVPLQHQSTGLKQVSATILGGSGNDTIEGGMLADFISGGSGDDSISGGGGNDVIHGGTGDDRIAGEAGDDTIHGGRGMDTLAGGAGNNVLK
jgi:Ca2+-binding RTX toxin-like protein